MSTITKQRNTNIEILRFILMCFIFFWHILVHGYNLKQLGGDEVTVQHSFFLYGFLLTLFVPATYCFVFIAIISDRNKEMTSPFRAMSKHK